MKLHINRINPLDCRIFVLNLNKIGFTKISACNY